MRNLTIKRAKRFVACLGTMRVFIEDPLQGELTINGVPCKKLGTLKNGEEKTFAVTSESAKVYVIADNLSRGYCNDFYELPAGDEDIVLTGKNKYNPASGNAFRFDNNNSAAAAANRSKGIKKGLLVLCIAFVIGLILGVAINFPQIFKKAPEPKSFQVDHMTITLTDEFENEEIEGITACFYADNVALFVVEESFDLMEGLEDYTLADYGALALEMNELPGSSLQKSNGLTYFEHDYTDTDGMSYHYMSFLFKSDTAFWIVEFATAAEIFSEQKPDILNWASTVSFS